MNHKINRKYRKNNYNVLISYIAVNNEGNRGDYRVFVRRKYPLKINKKSIVRLEDDLKNKYNFKEIIITGVFCDK
jgi:hypothetical protein